MSRSPFSNSGRVMLVTGGAGGIGIAISEQLSSSGATVIVADIDTARGRAAVDRLAAANLCVTSVSLDVTDERNWRTVVADIDAQYGRLDAIVHGAGTVLTKSIEETSLTEWRRVISINLDSVFLGTKAALPLMRRSARETPQGGSIVNISSISGIIGVPSMPAYGASKGALRQFTKSMALDFASRGYRIRVNSIHPGLIDTDMARELFEGSTKAGVTSNAEKARTMWASRYPIGRIGQPDDIASAVLFLVSDGSGFMTGSELVIDGGATAQ